MVATVAGTLALTACGGGAASPGRSTTPRTRPSSPAKISIVSPKNGQVIHGTTLDLKLALEGAKVVPLTTTNITPTTGHVHVFLDGKIMSMTAGLEQSVGALTPGQHTLRAEFVAADHRPFDPRVFTDVVFEVKS
jgi:hypothetical protein